MRSKNLWKVSMKALKINKKAGDIPLLICVFLMVCFGCLMIYSASSYTADVQYGDALYFVKKQIVGVVLGTAAMIGMCFLPYKKLIKFRYPTIIIAVILLVLVFIP